MFQNPFLLLYSFWPVHVKHFEFFLGRLRHFTSIAWLWEYYTKASGVAWEMQWLELVPYLLFISLVWYLDISFCFVFTGASKSGASHIFTTQSIWICRPPSRKVSLWIISGRCLQTTGSSSLHQIIPGSDHRTSYALQGKASQPCLKPVLVWGEVERWCSRSRSRILVNNVCFPFFPPCPCLFLSHSILKRMTQNSINPKFVSYWTMMWARWIWSLLKRSIAKQDSWRRWGRQFLKVGQFNPFCL